MNKIILLLTLVSVLLSFTNTKKSIIGLYGKCNDGYLACTQLELKNDSTFEYYTFFDVGGGTIKKGTWKVNQDTLIINTFNQPQFAKGYQILDTTQNQIKQIYCFDRDSSSLSYGTVIINSMDTLLLDENGKALYNSQINDIQIFGMGKQTNRFSINSNCSKIIFFVDSFICNSPEYLTNEKLIIEGNTLREYYYCQGRFADKGLKKTSIKNKKF